MCFSAINGSGPAYLSELLLVYTPSRTIRSSSDTRMLKIQQYNTRLMASAPSLALYEEDGPQYWALSYTVHELWLMVGKTSYWLKWTDCLSERYDWNHWSAEDWMPRNRVQAWEENLVVNEKYRLQVLFLLNSREWDDCYSIPRKHTERLTVTQVVWDQAASGGTCQK